MQSRKESLIEVLLNVTSGLLVAVLTSIYLLPLLWNYTPSVPEAIEGTILFTSISVLRGYIWRRFFNWLGLRRRDDVMLQNLRVG